MNLPARRIYYFESRSEWCMSATRLKVNEKYRKKSVGWRTPRLNKQLNAYYFRLIIFSLSCRSRTHFFCAPFSRVSYKHMSATYIHLAHNTRCMHGRMGTCLQHTTCLLHSHLSHLRVPVASNKYKYLLVYYRSDAHTWVLKCPETAWMCAATSNDTSPTYNIKTHAIARCVPNEGVCACQAAGVTSAEMRNTKSFFVFIFSCASTSMIGADDKLL